MQNKKLIGILCGGKSAEHEISLLSAKNIYAAIDAKLFEPILIGIDKDGQWRLRKCDDFIMNSNNPKKICLNLESDKVVILSNGKIFNPDKGKMEIAIDVIFPILHGTFGEDGTIQGLLKLANIPFVGAGVLGSAVGMDKDIMKRLLRDAGINIGKFITARKNTVPSFESIIKELGCPVFIKPANLGSSVGINKAKNKREYEKAINEAFLYDTKIIIEEYIPGREIECAVLGNENPIASIPGEVIVNHEFYSYDAKYIDASGAELCIPANISKDKQEEVKNIAIKTYKALDCEGFGRVDMFLKENGELVVNEINTIPGFTKSSMYPKLWEASGIGYIDLITKIIDLAFERFEKEKKLKTSK